MDIDTRQYLEVLFQGVSNNIKDFKDEIQRLNGAIVTQGTAIHTIEINTTKSITEINSALNNLTEKVKEAEVENNKREMARIDTNISFGMRLTEADKASTRRWEEQALINEGQKTINTQWVEFRGTILKLFISILTAVIGLIVVAAWNRLFP